MKYIVFISVIFLINSCNLGRDVDLVIKPNKHIYVNGINSSAQSYLAFKVGMTQSIVNQTSQNTPLVDVNANINGKLLRTTFIQDGYRIDLPSSLKPDDEIELNFFSGSLHAITKCKILAPTMIKKTIGEWNDKTDINSSVRLTLELEPTTPNKKKYYRAIIRSGWYDTSENPTNITLNEKQIKTIGNPLFNQEKDQIFSITEHAPFAIFSLASENTVTFDYIEEYFNDTSHDPMTPKRKYKAEVELQSISKDYYLYLLTLMRSQQNNAFSNPVKIHGNIRGGAGIFAIYTSSISQVQI